MGRRFFSGIAAFAMLLVGLPASPTLAASPDLVISQVYGGGGNTGAPFNADFIEIFNRGTVPASLAGKSLQYASATGTGNFGGAGLLTVLPAISLNPGQYFLAQQAGGAVGAPLPTADVVGTTNMSATGGKVAIVNSTTSLGCNGGSTPCSATQLALIIDLIGYDGANFFEVAPAPTLSNTTSAQRAGIGCIDTDNNAADFTAGAPAPRNSLSARHFCDADVAPSIASRAPASGATNVAVNASILITFSEAVTTTGTWYSITCTTSGAHDASATSSDSVTYSLDPTTDFASTETCTVSVFAAQVMDQDANDPPDTMTADATWSFSTIDATVCGDPATRISEIQGTALTSGKTGQVLTIEGVVVGDYQGPGQFTGYYVQEEVADQDSDPATSEGIFVFSSSSFADVSAGQVVRLRGTVSEFSTSSGGVTSSLTQLGALTRATVCASGASVPATTITLPVDTFNDFERYEGMLVRFEQTLTATETFTLARFGEVRLAADGRLYTPTAVTTPGAAAIALADENRRRSFVLDDGNNQQNIDPTLYPTGGLSASNTLRSGYTVNNLTGVFDHRFGVYRVQPVAAVTFAASNPRPAAPAAVGGNTKVASFNVLNYFNGNGTHLPGAAGGFPTSRGATTLAELDRQTAKEVSALSAMNADIVGLMEIENDGGPASALADLVGALNAAVGAGTYAYIDTGVIGTDEIKVALIYKPATVTPLGAWQIITSATDPRFIDTRNRPSLAQTFARNGTTEKVTVVVNHLKSKGSGCEDIGDPDIGDGQGNCNLTRARAAAAIRDWLATDPTHSGSPNFLVIGDMNAYTFEDPITTFTSAGYVNLVRAFDGLDAYSYVFNGEAGYLDHALATPALVPHVTGAAHWHINADEPIALDYNVEFKSANQVNTFYASDAYRSSDHDPILIGIDLSTTADTLCALTRTLVSKTDVADGLCDKLAAAAASLARGNTNAHDNQLGAFINQVNAQRGKSISDADATRLIDLARTLFRAP